VERGCTKRGGNEGILERVHTVVCWATTTESVVVVGRGLVPADAPSASFVDWCLGSPAVPVFSGTSWGLTFPLLQAMGSSTTQRALTQKRRCTPSHHIDGDVKFATAIGEVPAPSIPSNVNRLRRSFWTGRSYEDEILQIDLSKTFTRSNQFSQLKTFLTRANSVQQF
jgi:hypothetical protein